jgi:hypothetical protein
MDAPLCMPAAGLSCFACCPPIRPAGYDHASDRGSWRRIFSENRSAFLAGRLPQKAQVGFSCPGLGFLDSKGSQVGCLLHPARNQGFDLRGPTGYRDKCDRESCSESRAFAALSPQAGDRLIGLCAGMDPFQFSSRRLNPVMRLLAFGPEAAEAAAGWGLSNTEDLAAWDWLGQAETALGWLLARMLDQESSGLLGRPDLAASLAARAVELAKRLGPTPPTEQGEPLFSLCDEWEARFWRFISGRQRALPSQVQTWRSLVAY